VEGGTYNGNASNGIQVQNRWVDHAEKIASRLERQFGRLSKQSEQPHQSVVTVASTMSYSNISFLITTTAPGCISLQPRHHAHPNQRRSKFWQRRLPGNNQAGSTAGVTVINSHFHTNNSGLSGAGLFIHPMECFNQQC
jgi:hypothetical protein